MFFAFYVKDLLRNMPRETLMPYVCDIVISGDVTKLSMTKELKTKITFFNISVEQQENFFFCFLLFQLTSHIFKLHLFWFFNI